MKNAPGWRTPMQWLDPRTARHRSETRQGVPPSRRAPAVRALLLVTLTLAPSSCATGFNYADPEGPRFTGSLPAAAPDAVWRQRLKVVTFNVEYGQEAQGALDVLRSDTALAGADVVLLQEMDTEGTRLIAEGLGMAWVYHPATRRGESRRDFGNAVLSRWTIVADEKLVLPHRSIFGRTLRTATVATIQVGRTPVRVYSVHLATPVNQAFRDRADQMRAVLRDASSHPHVILGGDLNSTRLGEFAAARGYYWPTEEGPATVFFGRIDHVFMKGFDAVEGVGSGTVEIPEGVSDHLPVWAVGVLR